MVYFRSTIEIKEILDVCNEKLRNPKYTQDQKKAICEVIEETLRWNGFGYDTVYWLEYGKKQWTADGCPEIPVTPDSNFYRVGNV